MQRVPAAKRAAPKKSNGQKKANGANVNIRQATSSLNAFKPSNANGGPVRSVPAAMGSTKITGKPNVVQGRNGDCRVVHREYLSEVAMTNGTFGVNTFPMNVGLGRTFPWLSGVAARYESYRFNKLRFSFETSCSSTQTGTVMLIPDYDASDAAPASKVQGMSYRNSARAQAWLSFCQDSSSEDLNKQKSYFIRQGAVPANSDVKLYDVGNLFLCVIGSDTNVVGELWVEYDVHLMTPQFINEALSARLIASAGVSDILIFGTITNPGKVGILDITASGNTIIFNQAWTGFVLYEFTGTGMAIVPVLGGSSTSVAQSSISNATATSLWATYFVTALIGQSISLDMAAATTVTNTVVFLADYD
jgi:hypothetical protein